MDKQLPGRPLPPGTIGLNPDQPGDAIVDAGFLAARLGMTEAELRDAMQAGRVTGRVERGEQGDAGRWRLVFRGQGRGLALLIEPDGRCYEQQTAGPRRTGTGRRRIGRPYAAMSGRSRMINTLRILLRSVLLQTARRNALVDDTGILHGLKPFLPDLESETLQRGLAILMEEDARADRPFLSALVFTRPGMKPWDGFVPTAARLRRFKGSEADHRAAAAFWKEQRRAAQDYYSPQPLG
ncbi:MAG: hypothetical protein JJT90_15220 [Ectothiorhodospiraceae bacterium]|nr:hypothetical protein [Ectothiorhodospiraceae bacterium]